MFLISKCYNNKEFRDRKRSLVSDSEIVFLKALSITIKKNKNR